MENFETIKIRKMTTSNLSSIKENLYNDFNNFWNYDIFKSELENNNSSYLYIEINNEIVCYGGLKFILDEAELMNIVTKQNKRNLGLAKSLMQELINLAKEKKCTKINLEVNINNKNAIHLYELFNFNQVGIRKKYYNNTDDAILMTLYL